MIPVSVVLPDAFSDTLAEYLMKRLFSAQAVFDTSKLTRHDVDGSTREGKCLGLGTNMGWQRT